MPMPISESSGVEWRCGEVKRRTETKQQQHHTYTRLHSQSRRKCLPCRVSIACVPVVVGPVGWCGLFSLFLLSSCLCFFSLFFSATRKEQRQKEQKATQRRRRQQNKQYGSVEASGGTKRGRSVRGSVLRWGMRACSLPLLLRSTFICLVCLCHLCESVASSLSAELSSFFEVAFHTLLHDRGLYPSGLFASRRSYGVGVFSSCHPLLNTFVHTLVESIQTWLLPGEMQRIVLVVLDPPRSETNNKETPRCIERFVFEVSIGFRSPHRPTITRNSLTQSFKSLSPFFSFSSV